MVITSNFRHWSSKDLAVSIKRNCLCVKFKLAIIIIHIIMRLWANHVLRSSFHIRIIFSTLFTAKCAIYLKRVRRSNNETRTQWKFMMPMPKKFEMKLCKKKSALTICANFSQNKTDGCLSTGNIGSKQSYLEANWAKKKSKNIS